MTSAVSPTTASAVGANPQDLNRRIVSIDVLRGLVMIWMALDHTREYFHASVPGLDPTDPAHTYVLLYATRWVTYFCAPTFVLLSGIAAWLRGRRALRQSDLSVFLATRGLWLLLLELTVVATGFTFHPGYIFLQVIWVIGAGFLVLSLLCRLPARIVLMIGVLIVAGHNLLDYVHNFAAGGRATAWHTPSRSRHTPAGWPTASARSSTPASSR